MTKTVLFIDFDNTISIGDVLDRVIEKFSRTKRWLEWERAWVANRLSSLECLRLQIGDLDVSKQALLEYVRGADIDPGFVRLQQWACNAGAELIIVSDNFELILREVLHRHGVVPPTIFANTLAFESSRLVPSFPYRSATCTRCAHCKASHFSRYNGYRTIYVGDGLSDLCPALRADQVFAKDTLAKYLLEQGRPFVPFSELGDVVDCLLSESPRSAITTQAWLQVG